MKKIALHACCAPCLTGVLDWLLENDFAPTAYYYNPNIFPEAEYVKRYFVLKNYCLSERVPLVFEFDNARTIAGDCQRCFEARLRKTAEFAKSKGWEYFSTTLLISPYQRHELLRETGEAVASETGVHFFYFDWRVEYQRSRDRSRRLGLYRQKFCGCEQSKKERKNRRNRHDQIAAAIA